MFYAIYQKQNLCYALITRFGGTVSVTSLLLSQEVYRTKHNLPGTSTRSTDYYLYHSFWHVRTVLNSTVLFVKKIKNCLLPVSLNNQLEEQLLRVRTTSTSTSRSTDYYYYYYLTTTYL